MFVIRWVLGRIILFFNFIFSPKKLKRPIAEQQKIDDATKNMTIYEYKACPFCVKTRRAIHRLNVDLELRDIKHDQNRETLEAEGGRVKVPCLRIEEGDSVKWLYESNDIISYLDKQLTV